MELREFISTVLVSIVRGVEDAQRELEDSRATINPLGLKAQIALQQGKEAPEFKEVEFEVAVEVLSKGKKSGSVGVQLAVFKAGVEGEQQDSNSNASRLRFSVPIHLPPGNVLKIKKRSTET